MKKNTVIACVVLMLAMFIGFIIGINAVLNAPKWVEEDGGLYIICTDFMGNVYEDVADKASLHYDALWYVTARR